MRYRIEFLLETTEEDSVCLSRTARTTEFALAELQAQAWSRRAWRDYGAHGFQIRDLDADGDIVAIEAFDRPATIH